MDENTQIPFKQYFPNLSLSAFFWLVIFSCMIIFSIVGFLFGMRVSELPSSNLTGAVSSAVPTSSYQQFQPPQSTPGQYDDNDIDYSNIDGNIITNTSAYDQAVVTVNGLPTTTTILSDTDYRTYDNPHVGIEYPYVFSRLNPARSYAVSASSCRTDPKTYALVCAKNIKITKCTGTIQGNTCIIKGNGVEVLSSGEVDFSIPKK
jgi:hypothetical protein